MVWMDSLKGRLGFGVAVAVMAAVPVWGQAGESGVSRPSTAPIVSDPVSVDGYVPTPRSAGTTSAAPLRQRVAEPAGTVDSDGVMVSDGEGASGGTAKRTMDSGDGVAVADGRPVLVPRQHESALEADGGIVTQVLYRKGELAEGTLLKVRMKEALSSATAKVGSRFSAELTEAVERDGTVLIPAGSVLEGQVTEAHGGRRISGGAALHLVPRTLTLPDGTHYVVHGQVIDTGMYNSTRVDSEGTIYHRDHAKETLAAMGLATGSAAAAGAVLGGGVGAVVGAGVGAGVGTVVWLKQEHDAGLPRDTVVVFSLTAPMTLNGARE